MADYDHYLLINNLYVYVMKNDGTYTYDNPTDTSVNIAIDHIQLSLPNGLTKLQIPQISGYTSFLDTTIDPAYGIPSKDPVWVPATSINIEYNTTKSGSYTPQPTGGGFAALDGYYIGYKYNAPGDIPTADRIVTNKKGFGMWFDQNDVTADSVYADKCLKWKNETPADEYFYSTSSNPDFSYCAFSVEKLSDAEVKKDFSVNTYLDAWAVPLVEVTNQSELIRVKQYCFKSNEDNSSSKYYSVLLTYFAPKGPEVVPYPGSIGDGELVILSSNPQLNRTDENGNLDPSGRVFDSLGIRVISDIVDDTGKREVTVTTTRGDYMPSPYDVLVRNTVVGLMSDSTNPGNIIPPAGNISWSSMSPFAPYLGYYHQDFPLFLESYADGKYTFVNLFSLKLKYVREADPTGNNTYPWIKKCYDDFLKTHSFMICYYLGITNHGHNYLSFYPKSPGDNTDWGGASIPNDSETVATVSDVLQESIADKGHGFMLQEGFLMDDTGNPWYFGAVYYDYTSTIETDGDDTQKRVITYMNLQNEHVLQYSHNGRDFSENPRIIKIWRQSATEGQPATDEGTYALDANAKVVRITNMSDLNAPQYSKQEVLISPTDSISDTVYKNVKYALTNRDVDMSIVIDLANRYSSSMLSTWRNDDWTPEPSFHTYSGWVQVDFSDSGTPPVILQFKEMDFIAQTMLLATNNDLVLKERV